ncbi:PaaI family thioesterase [Acidiferrimicrobium sp. IK]|uniref:PaaI family thioesterase n=1 Tax=Acidiferrimicrobium sp. IK TaxID=2871700 RepID=UPI0021CB6E1C|nr:PaaI family thioesterase [Acidiferrimicrobium sp. IK]MCU4186361.1 PaaI family thioesterase [Acidiferrimicrobium sp. IK]
MNATGDGRDYGEEATEARRALAAAIRALTSAMLLTTAGRQDVARAAELVAQAQAALGPALRTSRYEGIAGLAPGAPSNQIVWETHAAFGRSNPMAPPVVVEESPGRLTGTVSFEGAWEGAPGLAYGGFVAAAFDGLLGRTVLSAGHLAVTRSLAVRFRRPTPLRTPMRVEAVAGERSGRDVPVTGRLWDGDVLLCEAEAVFACVEPSHYRL